MSQKPAGNKEYSSIVTSRGTFGNLWIACMHLVEEQKKENLQIK